MKNRDLVRLKHMLDSARAILTFCEGKQRNDLSSDRLLASGVVREFEILGEAANAVSKSVQEQFQEIPWKSMIAMRNRLIHAYFDIDYDLVWNTIELKIPDLFVQVEKAILFLTEK